MNSRRYIGRAWRSRFLRAPKAAMKFAAREDFAPLGALAKVRLGLKTGKDDFFYVRAVERVPHTVRLGSPRARATVAVRGLRGRWEGEISAADLRLAVLNPHTLFGPHGRLLMVPSRPEAFYLYPQDRPPAADLADYIAAGVERGVHQGRLVRGNAAPGGRWYRQARELIVARWALPYNSAYDYGAHDNQVGAVLNGRFVGVDPLEGVDEDLLGAASTAHSSWPHGSLRAFPRVPKAPTTWDRRPPGSWQSRTCGSCRETGRRECARRSTRCAKPTSCRPLRTAALSPTHQGTR
jgi:hypothetical protein